MSILTRPQPAPDGLGTAVQPIELTDEQDRALAAIDAWVKGDASTFVLFGWAGTGKTTVVSRFIRDNPNARVCALTGKAASVLRKKTGLAATTVHGLIYKLVECVEVKGEPPKLQFIPRYGPDGLKGSIIVLDECSMISERMARDILATGARIIACGDPGQLPPVEGKRFFDLPDFTLRHIHRQALESPVIRQAHRVRLGGDYAADGDAFRVVAQVTDDDLAAADVVLVWRHTTRQSVNKRLRRMRRLFGHPKAGEPVLCLQNAHLFGLFNGGVYPLAKDFRHYDDAISLVVDGAVVEVPYVRFEGQPEPRPQTDQRGDPRRFTSRFDFGYALTVHKAQGSEWPNIVIFDDYAHQQHRREWRYTALTRSQCKVTIVRGGAG